MSSVGLFCNVPNGDLLYMLAITYAASLAIIAGHDNRFLHNYFEFLVLPFSRKRFGLAAVAGMIFAALFAIIIVLPTKCV